jgi:hypothetical protein
MAGLRAEIWTRDLQEYLPFEHEVKYYHSDQIRKIFQGHVACRGETRNARNIFGLEKRSRMRRTRNVALHPIIRSPCSLSGEIQEHPDGAT